MTIKQIGGVFGRNPEFNDVEVKGALDLPDGVIASFGNSKDFQIVHDGSHTYLTDGGDGNVYFRTNSQFNVTGTDGKVGIQFNPGVNVALRHNNVQKFTTTSDGAAVYGNLIMATAGGGIDFSATAGTGTSELFDDYEEGTWTPNAFTNYATTSITPGGSATYAGTYTKIGNMVYCKMDVNLNNGATSVAVGDLWGLSGLPFTSDTSLITGAGVGIVYGSAGSNVLGQLAIQTGGNNLYIRAIQVSGASNYGHVIRGQFSYPVA